MQIHQAIFGYFNGHHMLKCSRHLSNHTLKILEPLSDLSGSEMQSGFEIYLTGYPLNEEKSYTLSKTWYAQEMKRPGCVWTHTLFFDFSDLRCLTMLNNIDDLFIRPIEEENQNFDKYSKPIYIDIFDNDNIIENNYLPSVRLNEINHILKPLLESERPVVIGSEGSTRYNKLMEYLWTRLGDTLFKEVSFCTGSLSNRTINNKPLDIQIVPNSLYKNIARSIDNTRMIYSLDTNEKIPQWLLLFIREYIEQEEAGLKNFLTVFDSSNISRKYFKKYIELYLSIKNSHSYNTIWIVDNILKLFEGKELTYVINKVLPILVLNNIENFNCQNPAVILQELSIIENKNIVLEVDNNVINSLMEKLLETYSTELKDTFLFLICHEINSFGEKLIKSIASIIEPNQLSEITGSSLQGSNLLISINGNLALCKELWDKPINFQIETLYSLKNSINSISLDMVYRIGSIIFNTSEEDISKQLYEVFGDDILNIFLAWAENIDDEEKLSRWSKLCKYNISTCINKLSYIQNPKLLRTIISALDPYDPQISEVEQRLWINLYDRFCINSMGDNFCSIYARFLLPIIIRSNEQYPTRIVFFAFNTVNDVLSKDQMDYNEWNKLSQLLPEVAWYNNWDKCKRLRKAARKMNYNFELLI